MSVYLELPDRSASKYVPIDAAVVRWSNGREAGWEITKINAASKASIRDFLDWSGESKEKDEACVAATYFHSWKN